MANKNITLIDEAGNELYPLTSADNISGLSTKLANFASKDLSNVTFPIYAADGTTHTGIGDRVIEMKVSSDSKTWYRKWASGWKECGQIGITADNTYYFPITFNYIPTFISTIISTRNGASYDREKHINSLTNEQFTLPYFVAASAVSFSYYACGY